MLVGVGQARQYEESTFVNVERSEEDSFNHTRVSESELLS